jgi:simple sugar transport system ATP-binding protein
VEGFELVSMIATRSSANAIPPVLELRGISKSYGHVNALIDVDFAVGPGEVVGLLGDNGAGKSTLVRIMSGVERPDTGSFASDGQRVEIRSRRDSEAHGVETIYQDIALAGPMTITRNIFAGRELTTRLGFLRLKEMRRTAMDVLDHAVEISGITSPDINVEDLSGGQQQAVAIARALHFKNRILILDEPTSALSVRETENVLQYILKLRDEGVSCVFVTHNIYHAFRVCDRFVVMAHGRPIVNVRKDETTTDELIKLIVSN